MNDVSLRNVETVEILGNGRIRLGNFVEHFGSVEHISYSTGTSRNSVEHKRYQEK